MMVKVNRFHIWHHSGDAAMQVQIRLWRFEMQFLWWRKTDLMRGIQASEAGRRGR